MELGPGFDRLLSPHSPATDRQQSAQLPALSPTPSVRDPPGLAAAPAFPPSLVYDADGAVFPDIEQRFLVAQNGDAALAARKLQDMLVR